MLFVWILAIVGACAKAEPVQRKLVFNDRTRTLEFEPVIESCAYTRIDGRLVFTCEGLNSNGDRESVSVQ